MIPLRDSMPTRRVPYATYGLIALNVIAFIWESALFGGGATRVVVEWGLVPARFAADPLSEIPNIFSSMFLHSPATWWHLGGNMLFLWIFGDNVEDALGHGRFVGFYLLAGIVAALAQVVVDPRSPVPMVGASGPIAGVLAAYGSLFPRAPITLLNPILPLWLLVGPYFRLPAWLVILEFFVLNLLNGLASLGPAGGGVAFFAHLGGFLAGLVAVRFLLPNGQRPRRRHTPPWQSPPKLDFDDDDEPRPPPARHRR